MSVVGVWRWHREIAVLALDEQHRSGHPEIDLEHVFIALTSSGGAATEILAQHGVTLDESRAAFEVLHAERIQSLGIRDISASEPRGLSAAQPGGFVWSKRADAALQHAAQASHPDVALLTTLLSEPSGHIADAVLRMHLDVAELRAALTTAEATGKHSSPSEPESEWIRYSAYAPASVDAVWELLADPSRWLEWNGYEHESAELRADGVLCVRSASHPSDGKRFNTAESALRSEYVVSRFEAPRLIQWERSFPSHDNGRYRQYLRIELLSQGSGTGITLSMRQDHTRGVRKRILRALFRPLLVLGVKGYLRGKSDGVSRALRA